MGKLIRNGIEYGGGNGTDIFEVTQAEYDALVQAGTLVHNALYVITDAPNLNETAKQISYEGSTDTVWDKVEAVDELANKYNDASLLCTATITEPTLSNGTSVGHRTYYYKKGTRVFVSIAVSGLKANGQQPLFQLPQGYKPQNILLTLGCNSNFALDDVFLIKADGWVEMRRNSTTDAYGFFEFDAFA